MLRIGFFIVFLGLLVHHVAESYQAPRARSTAGGSRDYLSCLHQAKDNATRLLRYRNLHHVTRFCILQSYLKAENYIKQYNELIFPDMKAHLAEIEACKKNPKCKQVEAKKIYYSTDYNVNCNRRTVRYAHSCSMDRTLEGFEKKATSANKISRSRKP